VRDAVERSVTVLVISCPHALGLAIPLAAGVLAWAGVVLPPAAGALAMSASTVVVALNAMLLRRLELRPS
jgi:cation transport ATPase